MALTAQGLKRFQERSLAEFTPFARFLDTLHRGGEVFLVALGVDVRGEKMALGFWQGSSKNHEICEALFNDPERRWLARPKRILFVTDSGSGLKIALEQTRDADVRQMLLELEAWLRTKNESAADSLLEAFEELLMVDWLKVPALLCKTLMSTNPIETLCSLVRHTERKITHTRQSDAPVVPRDGVALLREPV
jgi:transposase-like protein